MGSQIKVSNTGWEMGKEIFLCNATLASCPMKFYVLLDQWRVLYHLFGGNSLILLLLALDWKLKHQLFFCRLHNFCSVLSKENSFFCCFFCNACFTKGTLAKRCDIMKKWARIWGDYYLSYNTDFCSFFFFN